MAKKRCIGCGKELRWKSKISTLGWLLILAGIFLSPTIVALILIPIGYTRREARLSCPRHGLLAPGMVALA